MFAGTGAVLCQVVAALWDVVPADTPPVAGSSQTVGGSCGRTAKGSPRVWRGDSACGQTQAQPCGPLQSRVGFVCRHFSCEKVKVKLKLLVGVRVHALSESLSWEKTGEVACSGAAPPFTARNNKPASGSATASCSARVS